MIKILKTAFLNYPKFTFPKINYFHFTVQNKKEENKIQVPRSELKKIVSEKDNVIKKQIKGSGPGGQHVNKTASAVMLKDVKTNVSVKVGNSRDSVVNSGIAKKRLVDKLDVFYNGAESKMAKKMEKIKKQKDRQRRKSSGKYQPDDESTKK